MKTEIPSLLVTRASVKETSDGGKTGDATLKGAGLEQALALVPSIGQAVEVAADDHRLAGRLRQIVLNAGKDDASPCAVTLKIAGPSELKELVGRNCKVRDLQVPLPLGKPIERRPQ